MISLDDEAVRRLHVVVQCGERFSGQRGVAIDASEAVQDIGDVGRRFRAPLIHGAGEGVLVLVDLQQGLVDLCEVVRIGLVLRGGRFDLGGDGALDLTHAFGETDGEFIQRSVVRIELIRQAVDFIEAAEQCIGSSGIRRRCEHPADVVLKFRETVGEVADAAMDRGRAPPPR